MQKLRLREGEGPSEREKRKEKEKHPKTRRSRAGFRFLSEKVRRKTAAPSPSLDSLFRPSFLFAAARCFSLPLPTRRGRATLAAVS
jgi:hypothetical protein